MSAAPRSRRRADLAAAAAGIAVGLFAGTGLLLAGSGGDRVVTCAEPGTGALVAGADCARNGSAAQEAAR